MNKIYSVALGGFMALSLAACNTTEPELMNDTVAAPAAAGAYGTTGTTGATGAYGTTGTAGAYGATGVAGQTGVGVTNEVDQRNVNPGTAAPPPVTREPDMRTTVPTPGPTLGG